MAENSGTIFQFDYCRGSNVNLEISNPQLGWTMTDPLDPEIESVPVTAFDPGRPVVPAVGANGYPRASVARQSQRQRRAVILAAIRQLLIEGGLRNVTVRRIAELSGHVVQTVYNLVGPRDHAVIEAISDYTQYIGGLAPLNLDDPAAIIKSIDLQGRSVLAAPGFTRRVCQIYYTDSRHIFLGYRERQIRNIHAVLVRQKRLGVLRRDVECNALARNLMLLSGAIFLEWADGAFPDEELVTRLKSGYSQLLAGTVSPRFGGLSAMPI